MALPPDGWMEYPSGIHRDEYDYPAEAWWLPPSDWMIQELMILQPYQREILRHMKDKLTSTPLEATIPISPKSTPTVVSPGRPNR